MDSNSIRDTGFNLALKDYPSNEVDRLLAYHRSNGGLSRYAKFRYFFSNIRMESVGDEKIRYYAQKFSDIVKGKLLGRHELLIRKSVEFILAHHNNYDMYVTSASDELELREICDSLQLSKFFVEILGSPAPKEDNIRNVIEKNNLTLQNCLLVGDSINDFEAAMVNGIEFKAFNNHRLSLHSTIDFPQLD